MIEKGYLGQYFLQGPGKGTGVKGTGSGGPDTFSVPFGLNFRYGGGGEEEGGPGLP